MFGCAGSCVEKKRVYYGRIYYGKAYHGRVYYGRVYYGSVYYGRVYYGKLITAGHTMAGYIQEAACTAWICVTGDFLHGTELHEASKEPHCMALHRPAGKATM